MVGGPWRSVRADWREQRDRSLVVPGELFSIYQPVIGPEATLAWLNLAYILQDGAVIIDPEAQLQERQGLSREAAGQALTRLHEAGLLEESAEGGFVLRTPSSRGQLALRGWGSGAFEPSADEADPAGEPSAPGADRFYPIPPASERGTVKSPLPFPGLDSPGEPGPDAAVGAERRRGSAGDASGREALQAVVEFYENRIGLLGPVQYEKLRFWVEEKAMSPDVVAAAIEETTASAEHPRIQYLEGVLRNWYNDGVRSIQDLIQRRQLPSALEGAIPERRTSRDRGTGSHGAYPSRRTGSRTTGGQAARGAGTEGVPNASAYRKVDPEDVKRWKELYPDDYAEG